MSNTDIEKAKNVLKESGYSLVLTKGFVSLTSYGRGIAPIFDVEESGVCTEGFSAADKIVGRAAAFLFIRAKVVSVYGEVMSRGAVKLLKQYGVEYSYNVLTDSIENRQKTGICPMENAVKDAEDPEEAFDVLKKTLETLKNAKK